MRLGGLRVRLMLLVAIALIPATILSAATGATDAVSMARNLGAVAVIATVAFGAAWIAAESFVLAPVGRVVDAARRMRDGDLTARAAVAGDGDDEIADLARAFDEMAAGLERDHAALREVDRLKSHILNSAAHELNTPLTPLRIQVHLLKSDKDLAARHRNAVSVVDRNVDRLTVLVRDMLDVARLQSGRSVVRTQHVDLADLVKSTKVAYAGAADGFGVDLALQVDDALPVNADPHRISQVLDNLVANALKFTPRGGGVRLEARREGGDVVVRVRDTGIGIPAEHLPRLFQPFSQVHDAKDSACTGNGLGLYLSKGIVEQHGGHISVASPGLGRGTTLTVTLPAA